MAILSNLDLPAVIEDGSTLTAKDLIWRKPLSSGLRFVDPVTVELTIEGCVYHFNINGDSSGMLDMLNFLEALADEHQASAVHIKEPSDWNQEVHPVVFTIDGEGWDTIIRMYPAVDPTQPHDVWLQIEHIRTHGIKHHSEDFRILVNRKELLKKLVESLESSLGKDPTWLDAIAFDLDRFNLLKRVA